MKVKFLHIALLFVAINSYAQKAKVQKADKMYEKYAYIDAVKTYENVAEKGYKSVDLFQKLGNAYYFNGELNKANKWYDELFAMNETIDPEYYYRYSQTLKSVGQYDKANKMLDMFSQKNSNDQRAKLYVGEKNYLDVIKANSGRYTIDKMDINSENSDYGTSFFGDELVFASNRATKNTSKKIQKWTNQPFTKLYSSKLDSEGKLSAPQEFSHNVDSKFNESTPVFTNDGKTMYFTRNNFNNGKKGKDDKRVTLLKIYRATLENGKWKNVTELPFNNDGYSVAHPALSVDEKTLYFASDMPGTLGQSDIFKVSINNDGTYGTPINLGNSINTEGKETFPFVSNENQLYFSSDGQPGLGGLDVYMSKIKENNTYEEPMNVGAPINGSLDDFAFMIDTKSKIGFFSSNREGGQGYDDIYKFKEDKKITCEQLLSGVVTDHQTGKILADAKVSLFDKDMKLIKSVFADHQGMYVFDSVECGKTYSVRAEKRDYLTKESRVTLLDSSGKTDLPIVLEKNRTAIEEGIDIAKVLGNIIIYFDLDKSFIRPDAAVELAKIVEVMKENPTIKVDVRSHTDSRQTHKYNEALSDRRAKATVAWMVKEGIAKDRLTGKGYGETQLVNKCSDGVECTEAEHQLNRRSEFIIIKK